MTLNYFKYNDLFKLELGGWLPEFQLAYTTYGKLNKDGSNVIWVCHAFTGNADPADWWNGLIGEGRMYNPDEHYIVCANILGSHYGSTNPLSINVLTNEPYFQDFPIITIRDVVRAMDMLRESLGIAKINTLLGGSLGGQQALEWAILRPELIENLILFSTNAVHSSWGIALNESQRMAIAADPTWLSRSPKAGMEGMKVARSIALLSYRNYETYNRTQARDEGQTDYFRANTYQNYQGEKLGKRFNAYSYWYLSKMFDTHDVGRGRGSVMEALQQIKTKTLVIGISSDILFPPVEQEFLAKNIPNAKFELIESLYGHDGFLIEYEAMMGVIREWNA
jgi:homoserine O-acetyltransferase/O-succinyltransferase